MTIKKKNYEEETLEIHIPRMAKHRVRPRPPEHQKIEYIHTNVPEGKAFFTNDGKRIHNLTELASTLEHMEDHVFTYHVNAERNDFSNWIHDVMGQKQLAEAIRKKDKDHIRLEILGHVVKKFMDQRK